MSSIKEISIEKALEESKESVLIDVRTASEYAQGHLPNAYNIPLFDDEQRAVVGTIYKKESPVKAITKALAFAQQRMPFYEKEAMQIAKNKKAIIYCWRGGMRSHAFAFVLQACGIQCNLIIGGYKSFRRAVQDFYSNDFKFIILGGYTGSAKTEVLHKIAEKGEQVVDLEGLAHHKGSAFGSINEEKQSSTEDFENRLWDKMHKFDLNKVIWLEDESRQIGKNNIPDTLYKKMKEVNLIQLIIPKEKRIAFLVSQYKTNDLCLIEAINKITKRLGGLDTKNAIQAVKEHNYEAAAASLLHYYDKAYDFCLSKRTKDSIYPVYSEDINSENLADFLIEKQKLISKNSS
jgi:tRNA 2-selenouridine synthase